jgi:cobalt/nickel transport system permease protein
MLLSPAVMHIPDGFLSAFVSILFWILSVLAIGVALRRLGKDLDERQVPMMGVVAAAIFAGQMLNFAVAGGTSGHLLGATLATVLLGPWAAVVVMTCVVGIQALIFQDGGLLALGANIFNMGVIGVFVAFTVYRAVQKLAQGKTWGIYAGGFAAAWLSIEIAALAAALQLAVSGTSPANIAVPAMAGIHALIGIGEGLITVGALAFINATRPDLVKKHETGTAQGKLVWVVGLLLALFLVVVSPLASTHPDGLMWVAKQQGFLNAAQGSVYKIIPHYLLPGISNKNLATILAGVLGVLMVFGVAAGVAYSRRKRQEKGS